jgi:hypothetical protein
MEEVLVGIMEYVFNGISVPYFVMAFLQHLIQFKRMNVQKAMHNGTEWSLSGLDRRIWFNHSLYGTLTWLQVLYGILRVAILVLTGYNIDAVYAIVLWLFAAGASFLINAKLRTSPTLSLNGIVLLEWLTYSSYLIVPVIQAYLLYLLLS